MRVMDRRFGVLAAVLAGLCLPTVVQVAAAPDRPLSLTEMASELARIDIPPPDLPDPGQPAFEKVSERGTVSAEPTAIAVPALPSLFGDDQPPPLDAILSLADLSQAVRQALAGNPAAIWKRTARLGRTETDAILAFYAARDFAPVWSTPTGFTQAAEAVLNRLALAEEDALEPTDYPVIAPGTNPSVASLAEADIALTAATHAYARDARGGRINPSRLSRLITPDLDVPAPGDVIAAVANAPDPGSALAAFNPPHAGYQALRRKLADMRLDASNVEPVASVAAPRTARRAETAAPQRRIVTIADIIANMERWCWLPADLGKRYIMVNLPEFMLRVTENGSVIHQTRVIVGKPETPTPIFSHAMEYVIVNPSWYIPPSILKNEILPGLSKDPDYAARRGYVVTRKNGMISVRQPPGERNALGFIKFMFPNTHAVYLHDTPNRTLFGHEKRAFSHGCIRVEQPFRLAEFVLGDQGYSEARMRALIGKGERMIRLKEHIPVHLTYFTLEVGQDGRLVQLNDLYRHDQTLRVALGLEGQARRLAALR